MITPFSRTASTGGVLSDLSKHLSYVKRSHLCFSRKNGILWVVPFLQNRGYIKSTNSQTIFFISHCHVTPSPWLHHPLLSAQLTCSPCRTSVSSNGRTCFTHSVDYFSISIAVHYCFLHYTAVTHYEM
jgi:hypothetical protein